MALFFFLVFFRFLFFLSFLIIAFSTFIKLSFSSIGSAADLPPSLGFFDFQHRQGRFQSPCDFITRLPAEPGFRGAGHAPHLELTGD